MATSLAAWAIRHVTTSLRTKPQLVLHSYKYTYCIVEITYTAMMLWHTAPAECRAKYAEHNGPFQFFRRHLKLKEKCFIGWLVIYSVRNKMESKVQNPDKILIKKIHNVLIIQGTWFKLPTVHHTCFSCAACEAITEQIVHVVT